MSPPAPCHPRTSSAASLSAGTRCQEGLVIAVIANSLLIVSEVALFSCLMRLLCSSVNSLLTSLSVFLLGCGSSCFVGAVQALRKCVLVFLLYEIFARQRLMWLNSPVSP